jgi:hypothetical protein
MRGRDGLSHARAWWNDVDVDPGFHSAVEL